MMGTEQPPPDQMNAALLSWAQGLAPHGLFTTDTQLRIQNWNGWMHLQTGLHAGKVRNQHLLRLFPELQERHLHEYYERALKGEASMLAASFHGCLLRMPSTFREADSPHMLQTARISPLLLDGLICGTITTIEDVTQREHQNTALRRQHERDELLSWSLGHLLKAEETEALVRDLFSRVATFLKADIYSYHLVQPDTATLNLQSAAGIPRPDEARVAELPFLKAIAASGGGDLKPVLLTNILQSVEPGTAVLQSLGLRSFSCYPLIAGHQPLGALCFGSREKDQFTPEDLDLISIISQHVAVAMERTGREQALKAAREQLSRYADDLEKQVAERTAALEETIKELESFTYSVAHDLRAPIRSFKGYTNMLLEDHASQIPTEALRVVERIQRSADRMDNLTKDLLRYSKVSREKTELVPTKIEDALHEALVPLRSHLSKDAITIEPPLHPVLAQHVLLQQCLSNLLENAVKFVQPGKEPRLLIHTELLENQPCGNPHLEALLDTAHAPFHPVPPAVQPQVDERKFPKGYRHPACVRIWIEDNGIGIAPEFQKKIFGLFERVGDLTNYQGTGIGLAIVAKATQRMGGTCGVESKPGEGSRFWIELLAAT
ncbi:MAG TPA: ATP-binding protein [Candidatus Saccharimonadales bacterium]|nr:ATP-binding protein [Candidatus Saccharimonadales bacterium]